MHSRGRHGDLRDKWAERGNSFQAIGPSPSNNGSSGEVKPVGATVFDPASIKWTGKPRSVRQDLLSVPPLPQDLVPEPLRPWLSDIAERVSCPLDFAVVPALVALGTVLGRKIGMRPKAHDVWTVIPNPWGAIIGRPGVLSRLHSRRLCCPFVGSKSRPKKSSRGNKPPMKVDSLSRTSNRRWPSRQSRRR